MSSAMRRLALTILLAASAGIASGAQKATTAAKTAPKVPVTAKKAESPIVRSAEKAPIYLSTRLTDLGRAFKGRVGIAVRSVDDGWETGWREDDLYPQQSVSKLWVAITALDAADHGRVKMTDQVNFDKGDLTLFHQPIAAKILGGGYKSSLDNLLFLAITTSDNTANDKLMRSVGGPKAVRSMIAAKNLGSIRFYDGERALQSRIAGLIWSPSYSIGRAFSDARSALPKKIRKAAFDRYVADPYDGASPAAITRALARLKRGELLSPASTRRLLDVMSHTKTGPNRLKGGLKPGWVLNHKTGTGQEFGGQQAGYNDVGILTAPDGKAYTVAVMIKLTSQPLPTRMTLMNNVVKAVIAQHEMLHAPAAQPGRK
jgi:beta-lactamase class A